MRTKDVLRIFFPHQYLDAESGILVGFQDLAKTVCCVASIAHPYVHHNDYVKTIHEIQRALGPDLQIIGLWISDPDTPQRELLSCEKKLTGTCGNQWFILHRSRAGHPNIVLGKEWKKSHGSDNVTVIVFDASQISQSYFLMDSAYKPESGLIACKTNLASVARSLADYEHENQSSSDDTMITDYLEHKHFVCFLQRMVQGVYLCFCWIFGLISRCFPNRLSNNSMISTVCSIPTTVLQLKTRFTDLKNAIHSRDNSPECKLRCHNAVSRHLVDVLLGLLMMYYLLQEGATDHIATYLMNWAENVASQLQELLHWMMGAPAGLKLNHHLDQFLGNFFLYHIYLWTGYLHFLKPILGQALWYISLAGFAGVSAQLSLVQDLLSMLTLHIYCFYVYAARLYSLQAMGLASLWRLFRGKKWNVLRSRVDSASYDVDQLFVGTLLFTILLFLLPTTALYYVIFTALRLVVLSIQGVLHKVAGIINSFPVYAMILWLVSANNVTDSVKFHVYSKVEGRPLYLSMQAIPASLMTILNRCAGPCNETGYTWPMFGKKLIQGHLIYPWIEPAKTTNS